jgi:hypothetical protein
MKHPPSDDEMQKEIKKFAFCKQVGLPYKGPAMALDANGEEKLSPEASAWMLQRIKDLPKLTAEESSEAGARAAENTISNRRRERAMAGPDEKRTPLQEALDRVIDERDAEAGIASTVSVKTDSSGSGLTPPPVQPGSLRADDSGQAQRPSRAALVLCATILTLMLACGLGFGLYSGACAQRLVADWRVTIASGLLSFFSGWAVPVFVLAPMYFILRAFFPKSALFKASDEATAHWFERLKMVLGPVWTICNLTISAVVGFAMSHDQLWLGWIVGCATSSVLACLYSTGLFLLSIIFWIVDRRVSVGKEFKAVVSALCWSALFAGVSYWVFTQAAPILDAKISRA